MFYLCTLIQGLPERVKLVQLEKENIKELKEQLKSYEGYINDIPLVIDPCKMCKNKDRKTEEENNRCWHCCWFYDSKFEMEVYDNSCATCRYKAKMLTDKKPCKDCDNGCNWEK